MGAAALQPPAAADLPARQQQLLLASGAAPDTAHGDQGRRAGAADAPHSIMLARKKAGGRRNPVKAPKPPAQWREGEATGYPAHDEARGPLSPPRRAIGGFP